MRAMKNRSNAIKGDPNLEPLPSLTSASEIL
jgi:hypothetical protein